MNDLKPCPFCGANAYVVPNILSRLEYAVRCVNHTCLASVYGTTTEQATARWNRRAGGQQ